MERALCILMGKAVLRINSGVLSRGVARGWSERAFFSSKQSVEDTDLSLTEASALQSAGTGPGASLTLRGSRCGEATSVTGASGRPDVSPPLDDDDCTSPRTAVHPSRVAAVVKRPRQTEAPATQE